MNARFGLKSTLALVLVASMTLGGSASGALARPAADVSGNTYTSPTYGYTVSWPGDWFVVQETTDPPTDGMQISNGLSFMSFVGDEVCVGIPGLCLASVIRMYGSDPYSNSQVMADANGNPMQEVGETKASVTMSYTYTAEDGGTYDGVAYWEFSTLVEGKALLAVQALTQVDAYPSQVDGWQQIIDSITLAEPAPLLGEPAPAFASGPWRIGIAAAAIDSSLPALGLSEKTGKEWIVVVADVTNWSTNDEVFDAKASKIQTAEMAKAASVAPSSTKKVATKLNVQPKNGTSIAIPPGETKRLALVYSIPEGGSEPRLSLGNEGVALTDILGAEIDPAALPQLARPGEVEKGKVTSIVDNNTIKVRVGGETRTVKLLGVNAATGTACYGPEATAFVAKLKGKTVLLESDPATSSTSAYVWMDRTDGTRVLVNHQLIEGGYAKLRALPAEARFGAWLADNQTQAQQAKVGLWSGCKTPKATPAASPAAGATPTA